MDQACVTVSATARTGEIEHKQARNEVVHAYSEHTKVRETFDPPEPIDLATGIRRMSSWVKEHGARQPVEFPGEIEIDRKLPPSWRSPSAAR